MSRSSLVRNLGELPLLTSLHFGSSTGDLTVQMSKVFSPLSVLLMTGKSVLLMQELTSKENLNILRLKYSQEDFQQERVEGGKGVLMLMCVIEQGGSLHASLCQALEGMKHLVNFSLKYTWFGLA